jgi:hypothetical protein
MTLTQPQRHIILGVVLVLVLAGGAVLGNNDVTPDARRVTDARVTDAAGPAHASDARVPAGGERHSGVALDRLNRTTLRTDDVDLFPAKSWSVAPAPMTKSATAPMPPTKPTAPPLPYGYLGQIEDKEGVKVFLVNDGDLLTAKQGDILDAKYRLDAVSEEQLTFVYLPLDQKQILPAGGK